MTCQFFSIMARCFSSATKLFSISHWMTIWLIGQFAFCASSTSSAIELKLIINACHSLPLMDGMANALIISGTVLQSSIISPVSSSSVSNIIMASCPRFFRDNFM